jgi:ferredoxin--NADP+ reductase
MTDANRTWRVAIVGSGPAAFYTAEALFKSGVDGVSVDLFDRLPVPFGLVRGGVAPDHQKIKGVVKVYDKIAANEGFRFFGNVCLGRDIQVEDLNAHYHQVVYAFGCESDSKLNVEGEDLAGVYAATDFVGWYNGHPDHRHHQFDLHNAKRVALVGNGNVAMDVARILLASPDELAKTDIAEHSLETLRKSTVEEVVLLGRRGPAQAAFSPKEIAEIAALPNADVVITKKDATIDELSAAWLEKDAARSNQRNADFCTKQAELGEGEQPNKLRCRFLVSPTALHGKNGKLTSVSIDHMQLQADDSGTPRPRPTGESEQVPIDLLFKAIGYRGEPVPGVPFEDRKGIVPNESGRVVEKLGGDVRVGHYAAGWCKRGPTGLIGTNSLDAKDTVAGMLADYEAQNLISPSKDDIAPLLAERAIDAVTWADWQRLDAWERKEGESRGKLRHKLTSIEELMTVIAELRNK